MKNYKVLASIVLFLIVLLIFVLIRLFVLFNSFDLILIGDEHTYSDVFDNYVDAGISITKDKEYLLKNVETQGDVNINMVGDYKIKYTLVFEGHKKKVERTVSVVDRIAPTLEIGKEEITVPMNGTLIVPTYTSTDNYDGDLTTKVKVTNDVDVKTPGDYKITYTVTDSSNNTTSKETIVHVKKEKNPHIEISINEQKLYYYEYEEVVLTSDVVTGIYNKTPKGSFKVIGKSRDIVLRGRDYASFVSYFIDFLDHEYGMHDASWRSKFGGTIYKTNGSHGCVNMPKDKIKELYSMVSIGTPVNIHD